MDGLYETVLVEDHRIRLAERHASRLELAGVGPDLVAAFRTALADWSERPLDGPTVVRFDVTADGVAATPRPPRPPGPVRLHQVVGYDPADRSREEKRRDRGWAVVAEAAAAAAGADEALLVTGDGRVGETCRANLFAVLDGAVVTPVVAGILPGVTRAFIVELTGAVERPLAVAELAAAEAVFLTTAGRGVVPVAGRGSTLVDELAAEWRRR